MSSTVRVRGRYVARKRQDGLATDGTLAIVCGDGARSGAAASILKRTGHRPALVLGGMIDWLEHGYPVETRRTSADG